MGENSGVTGKLTEGERERRGGVGEEGRKSGWRRRPLPVGDDKVQKTISISNILFARNLKPKLNQGCRLAPPLVIAAILAEVEQLVLSCIYNTLLKL